MGWLEYLARRADVSWFCNVGLCGDGCSDARKSHKRVSQTDVFCFVEAALCFFVHLLLVVLVVLLPSLALVRPLLCQTFGGHAI